MFVVRDGAEFHEAGAAASRARRLRDLHFMKKTTRRRRGRGRGHTSPQTEPSKGERMDNWLGIMLLLLLLDNMYT